jgi:hypothetical protein
MRKGDSGGPFYCRSHDKGDWTLVGIVSSSVVTAKSYEPTGTDFFVPVASSRFLEFLKKMKAQWKLKSD